MISITDCSRIVSSYLACLTPFLTRSVSLGSHLHHGFASLCLFDFLFYGRAKKCALSSKRFEEFVSSFHTDEDRHILIAASGEGTIQVAIQRFFWRKIFSVRLSVLRALVCNLHWFSSHMLDLTD